MMIKITSLSLKSSISILFLFLLPLFSAQNPEESRLLLEKEHDEIVAHLMEDPTESLIKLQELQDKALKMGDVYFANKCNMRKVSLYSSIGNYQKAIEYGNQAIEEAKAHQYTDIQATIMGLVASQYVKIGLKEEAIRMAVEAMKLAESSNSLPYLEAQFRVTMCYSGILSGSGSKKDALKCIELDEKTVQLAQKLNKSKYIRSSLLNLSLSYIENKQYEKAKKVNQQILQIQTGNTPYTDMYLYDRIGLTYLNAKEPDSAIYYFNKGLFLSKKLNMPQEKLVFLRQLKEAYKAKNNSEEKHNVTIEYDTVLVDQTSKKTKALQVAVKNIVNETNVKQKTKTDFFKRISIVSSILLLFSLLLYYLYYTRFKKQKLSIEEKEKIITEKQAAINQLQNKLHGNSMDEIMQYAVEDNPLFLKKYKEAYPDFMEKLYSLSSELTADELKCCVMIHLNFSTKEIASYTHTSIRTIENKKYRIRKKINMQDSQMKLDNFLINL